MWSVTHPLSYMSVRAIDLIALVTEILLSCWLENTKYIGFKLNIKSQDPLKSIDVNKEIS